MFRTKPTGYVNSLVMEANMDSPTAENRACPDRVQSWCIGGKILHPITVQVKNKLLLSIPSTPHGSHRQGYRKGTGGEFICKVWYGEVIIET
jgi:hypothetical protein